MICQKLGAHVRPEIAEPKLGAATNISAVFPLIYHHFRTSSIYPELLHIRSDGKFGHWFQHPVHDKGGLHCSFFQHEGPAISTVVTTEKPQGIGDWTPSLARHQFPLFFVEVRGPCHNQILYGITVEGDVDRVWRSVDGLKVCRHRFGPGW